VVWLLCLLLIAIRFGRLHQVGQPLTGKVHLGRAPLSAAEEKNRFIKFLSKSEFGSKHCHVISISNYQMVYVECCRKKIVLLIDQVCLKKIRFLVTSSK
jgi:hypothetical protein